MLPVLAPCLFFVLSGPRGWAHPGAGETVDDINQLLVAQPNDVHLLQRRAQALAAFGNESMARQDLSRALILDPENPSVLRQWGLLEARSGNVAQAEFILTKASRVARDPDVFLSLGRIRYNQGNLAGACSALEQGFSLLLGAEVLARTSAEMGCTKPTFTESTPGVPKPPPMPASLERQPYLQSAHPEGITIVWRTDVTSTGSVRYGRRPDALSEVAASPTTARQHEVALTGLEPDTRYYYAVDVNEEEAAGGDQDHYFQTAPVPGSREPLRVWVVGDTGTGGNLASLVRDAMVNWSGLDRPDFALHLGDMAHPNGTDAEFTTKYFDIYAGLLPHLTLWPAIGNHEGQSLSAATQTGPYFEVFVLPADGSGGGLPSGTEAYYSFNLGNTHFVVLDSHDSSMHPVDVQMSWLTADLAANESEWTVVSFHHSPYSRGHLNSDLFQRMTEVRTWVLPILEAGGVDLVLAGHSHTFERSYLLDGGYETPSTDSAILDASSGWATRDEVYTKPAGGVGRQGALYVTAGNGSGPVSGEGGHPVHCYEEIENGSLVLDFHENRLTLTMVRLDGSVTDKTTLVKGDAVVVTAPDGGKSYGIGDEHEIRWTTVGDVNTVDVHWSCDGGESWLPIAEGVDNTGTLSWNLPAVETTEALVKVQSADDSSLRDQSNARFAISANPVVRVVDFTSAWRVLDDGSDPGQDWPESTFDDSTWRESPHLDGCRRGGPLSPLEDSLGDHPSYLLRHTFTLEQVPDAAILDFWLEDGLVVWLNGERVYERHVEAGIEVETWATMDLPDPKLRSTELDSDLFVIGNNTVAVMVKQASPESARLDFRAALELLFTSDLPTESCPTPPVDIDTSAPVDSDMDSETMDTSTTGSDDSQHSGAHTGCSCSVRQGRGATAWAFTACLLLCLTRRRNRSTGHSRRRAWSPASGRALSGGVVWSVGKSGMPGKRA